jgi:peptide/nickel transport system substrate-binding protein
MEGEGEIPLPEERGGGGSMTKVIAAIVVIIIVVAAVAGALILMGGGEEPNEGPSASISASTDAINIGDTVTFDASASTDPDGDIETYTFNFGDGAMYVSNSPIATHHYYVMGFYMAAVIVEDDKGATDMSDIVPVTVTADSVIAANDSAPTAVILTSIDASQMTVDVNQTVDFDGSTSWAWSWNETAGDFVVNSSAITAFSWVVGKSITSNASTFGKAFPNAGIKSILLTVTATNGKKSHMGVSINVVSQGGGGPIARADTFVEATIGEPKTLDPAVAYDTASGEILENVYEHLIWYDGPSTATLIPQLATEVPTPENGGISEDGLSYTFQLKEGVKFHYKDPDGNYYTMDGYDVEYSLERVLTMNDPEGPVWMFAQLMYPSWPGPGEVLDPDLVDATVEVNPDDPFEVTVNTLVVYPGFLKVMCYTIGSVICMEAVEDHGGVVEVTQNEWMIRNEAGTGPYMLKTWEANQYVLMERFDDYHKDPAPIKYVIIKKVQDTGTRLMMLLAGDADFAYVPRVQRPSVIGNPDLRIVEGLPTFDLDFIGFNWNMSGDLDIGDVPVDFFTDMNIRNAFIYAFDFENFLTNIWLDTAIQPNGPIPMGMFAYDPSVPNYTYDLSISADFLNETDYAATGFHIILYYNAGNDEREAACFLLKEGMEDVPIAGDITVEVMALDWPTYLDSLYGFALPIFFLGWGPDYADPDDYVNPFLHSDGAYPYFLSLSNATLDAMIIEAAMELNETLRAEMYLNISWAVYENAYYIWTAQPTNFHVERAWVTGYYFNPMYSQFYFYAMDK